MDVGDAGLLTTLEERLAPAHSAVLVIDMQNDFCAEGGYIHRIFNAEMSANAKIAANIMALAGDARAHGVPVIWIAACYDPDKVAEPHLARQRAAGIAETCCASGSWGAEFFMVEPAPGETVVRKHRYDAFFGTGLDEMLKERGVRGVVATGVATDICVDSTVRSAMFHGYYVAVPADCVGSQRAEAHEATLQCLGRLFADVTDAATVRRIWAAAHA